MSDLKTLRAEIDAARDHVSGHAFDEMPEAFKDLESLKVRLVHASGESPYTKSRPVRVRGNSSVH